MIWSPRFTRGDLFYGRFRNSVYRTSSEKIGLDMMLRMSFFVIGLRLVLIHQKKPDRFPSGFLNEMAGVR